MPKEKIPRPTLVDEYISLRGMSQAQRLDRALMWVANPGGLAYLVDAAVRGFSRYENIGEAFSPPKPPLAPPTSIANGNQLARSLAFGGSPAGTWLVPFGRRRVKLRFLDHEVPPARATATAPKFENAFCGGGDSLLIRADALLLSPGHVPVVTEVKVTKPNGFDTDTFLALIQALAAAALFATDNQRTRLATHYHLGATPDAVDIALVLYKPAEIARATFQYRLDGAAWVLAHRLMREPLMPTMIRRIMFIHAFGTHGTLKLEGVADETR